MSILFMLNVVKIDTAIASSSFLDTVKFIATKKGNFSYVYLKKYLNRCNLRYTRYIVFNK